MSVNALKHATATAVLEKLVGHQDCPPSLRLVYAEYKEFWGSLPNGHWDAIKLHTDRSALWGRIEEEIARIDLSALLGDGQ
jgi:hypothetical protein